MKRLLYSSAVLLLFSASLIISQMSCQKEAQAQNTGGSSSTATQLNLLLFSEMDMRNGDKVSLWTSNADGSNKKQVPVSVPAGWTLSPDAQLSPDGKVVIFTIYRYNGTTGTFQMGSVNVDGSNQKIIHDYTGRADIGLQINSFR